MFSRVLTENQIHRINEASLTILDRIGVVVPHAELLSRFSAAGARVEQHTQRVRIPPELVARSLHQAGKSYTLYGRDLSKTAAFGQGKRNYNSISGEASWVDVSGGERRFATLNDVAVAGRFGDALENINIVGAMADPHELPAQGRCAKVLATLIRNTTKPLTLWFHDRASAHYLVEMMIALRGDEKRAEQYPLCYPFLEPISPLRFPFEGIDLLFETARINLPVPVGPMAQMGLSAPATIAGTLTQENAEILAGICVTQLIRPGMPVCYGGICHAFDMSTTQMIFAGPEQAIFGVAMTQMGKHYGLPVYVNTGLTDSKRPDAQAGLEAGLTLMLSANAGADIFGHMGICGVDQAASLDILTLQNEIIGYVESVMRTLDFSDDAIGLACLEEVGPGGGFIESLHTLQHFRRSLWFPKLLNRQYYQAWKDGGALDMEQRCRVRKEQILNTHSPQPLPSELARTLNELADAATHTIDRSPNKIY
ncbi:MAG: trimethylamine methyltransferase family protein [Planctomycetota bacterium]